MTTAEIKALVAAKVAGQGTMLDVGNALPAILNALCDLIDTAEGKITTAEGKITTLESAVATKAETQEVDDFEEFDTTTSYDENDIVRHNGKLYQFDVSHDPGAWDAQEVTQTNVLTIATAE